MDVPEGAVGLHTHCEHCVKVSRCAQAASVAGERCELAECPAGCGRQMHRCKAEEHRLLCPEERVACLSAEYGCPAWLPRRQQAAHLAACPASVVLCMAEWSRWPQLLPDGRPQRNDSDHQLLDEVLLERDQRLLRSCLAPALGAARRLHEFPPVPLRLPGTFDCSHLAPELKLDREAAAAEQQTDTPPGLQRSVCSQLARVEPNAAPPPPPPPPPPAAAADTGRDSSYMIVPPPTAALDTYANCECVHKIAKDLCKFCRHDPERPRLAVRYSWQPAPPEPGSGAVVWRRVERTERVRERPGKHDLDAVLRRMKQQALEEREAELAEQREREREPDGPRLAITVESISPRQPRPRTLYTFQCAQPLRRDEFAEHYRRVHGEVQGGAGGWLQQRCPLAQYGCPYAVDRLYPDRPQQRYTVSPVTGCVGVVSSDGGAEPDGDCRLTDLPFELLQLIAARLDPFSLNHLSVTCRLLRDVCGSLVESRGLVLLMWAPMAVDDGVTWRPVAKSWRFSGAFEPVRGMGFHEGVHLADHLGQCRLSERSRPAEPFSLLPVKRLGPRADDELQQRMSRARACLDWGRAGRARP